MVLRKNRFNLKDRIHRIIFQKDFQRMILLTKNRPDPRCATLKYYLFEQVNGKWQLGQQIGEKNRICYDYGDEIY